MLKAKYNVKLQLLCKFSQFLGICILILLSVGGIMSSIDKQMYMEEKQEEVEAHECD